MTWRDEWERRWKDEGLNEDEYPLDELPIVNESPNWIVTRAWRRTACENQIKDSRIWVTAPPAAIVHIEHEYGAGQAFDHPNIYGPTDDQGYLQWYNSKRTPGRMSIEVDGEPLIERVRFDLGRYEYCKTSRWSLFGNRPNNKPGQVVWDIEIQRRGEGE